MVRYVAPDWTAEGLDLADVALVAIRLRRDSGSSVACESRVRVIWEVVDQEFRWTGKQRDV